MSIKTIETWVKRNLIWPEKQPEPTPQQLAGLADAILNASN